MTIVEGNRFLKIHPPTCYIRCIIQVNIRKLQTRFTRSNYSTYSMCRIWANLMQNIGVRHCIRITWPLRCSLMLGSGFSGFCSFNTNINSLHFREKVCERKIPISICYIPAGEIRFSPTNCCFNKGFCNISTPGNTIIFIYFISFLFDSSTGMKPKTEVHVCRSSEMAGITSFSTLREQRSWQ